MNVGAFDRLLIKEIVGHKLNVEAILFFGIRNNCWELLHYEMEVGVFASESKGCVAVRAAHVYNGT